MSLARLWRVAISWISRSAASSGARPASISCFFLMSDFRDSPRFFGGQLAAGFEPAFDFLRILECGFALRAFHRTAFSDALQATQDLFSDFFQRGGFEGVDFPARFDESAAKMRHFVWR